MMGYLNTRVSSGVIGECDVIGANAIGSNLATTCSNSIYMGANAAGASQSTNASNVALGPAAGYSLNAGNQNVFVGDAAGAYLTSGDQNVCIGQRVCSPQSGNIFTATWIQSGQSVNLTTGSGNILIGRGFGAPTNGTNAYFALVGSDGIITRALYGDMVSGNWTLKGNLTAPSDKRLKRDLRPIENAKDKIAGLHGIIYKWKEWYKPDGRDYLGLRAQDVRQVLPEAVFMMGKGEMSKYMSVSYDSIIPVMIEDMKQRQRRIRDLEDKITALKETGK
jgi:hypothetical protein